MKTISRVLAFATALAPSLAFGVGLTCTDIQTLNFDTAGNPFFTATGANIEVRSDSNGKYGWIAEVTEGGRTNVEADVDRNTVNAVDVSVEVHDLVAQVLPALNWNDVVTVDVANIGVEANREDGAGMTLFALIDAKGVILGKVIQIGWGAGKCTN